MQSNVRDRPTRPTASFSRLKRSSARSAFTILELILVLTIIVALAGLSWPQLSGFLRRESISSSVENVRQTLDHARVQSVEDGIIYQFRFEPNGRKFVLLPSELLVDLTQQQASPAPTTGDRLPGEIRKPIVQELSKECRFYIPPVLLSGETQAFERLPEPWLNMIQYGERYRDINWASPILYYPDGSASDARITIVDEDKRVMTLSVRGLTGAVATSQISQLQETFGAAAE